MSREPRLRTDCSSVSSESESAATCRADGVARESLGHNCRMPAYFPQRESQTGRRDTVRVTVSYPSGRICSISSNQRVHTVPTSEQAEQIDHLISPGAGLKRSVYVEEHQEARLESNDYGGIEPIDGCVVRVYESEQTM